eukprot:GILI01040725.1.p1 GENE.GILI01040725.1~~GILI01040725.1.p1  ORF type:complete len:116 (+),score=13.91 GILI01040725.1:127-474(+)
MASLTELRLQGLSLYRQIFRLHRHRLPIQLRAIGDMYVRDEFKRHHKSGTPQQYQRFLNEWKKYAAQLEEQHADNLGTNLSDSEFEALNDEQKVQLKKLRESASKFNNPPQSKSS